MTLRAVLPVNSYASAAEKQCQQCEVSKVMVYWYMGHDFGVDELNGTTPPTVVRNQILRTTITAITDKTIEVGTPPMVSKKSAKMIHDDSPAFQRLIDKLRERAGTMSSNGGTIEILPGQYPLASTLDFSGSTNIRFVGLGSEGEMNATQFVWHGPTGGTVFDLNQTRDETFENFAVTDNGGANTPGVIFDIDNYPRAGGHAISPKHNRFAHLDLQRSGIAVRIGNRAFQNLEMMVFDDIQIDSPFNGQGGWIGYYIAGAWQTYDEQIRGGLISGRDMAVYLNSAGSVDLYATDFEWNKIDLYLNDVLGAGGGHVVETAIDSEAATQHVYLSYGTGSPVTIAIRDSRLIGVKKTLASNKFYIVDNACGGLELSGDSLNSGPFVPDKVLISCGDNRPATLLSLDSLYGDPDPFFAPSGTNLQPISINDHALSDPSGHVKALTNRISDCGRAVSALTRRSSVSHISMP
jgi:hypothetical protein